MQLLCTSLPVVPRAETIRETAMATFKELAERVFGTLNAPVIKVDADGNLQHVEDDEEDEDEHRNDDLAMQAIASPLFSREASDVRHRVASLLFGVAGPTDRTDAAGRSAALAPARAALSGMQQNVFSLVAGEVKAEADRLGAIAHAAIRSAGRSQQSATAGALAV